jgi:serine/threonine protein phosphatase PrpC
VRTASRFGAHSFEIDAGGRSFYFKVCDDATTELSIMLSHCVYLTTKNQAETEEEMRKWLFAFQCAVARNLDKVLMAETRRRQKLMSSLKKWWKQFIDWESVISGADQGADEEDCPPSPSRAGEVSSNADLRLNVVTCDRQGARAYMEDQSFVVTNTAAKFKTANCYACLGVFDGHGGAEAAQYCKDKMASKLFQAPLTMDTISETITKAFQEIDAEFFDIAEQADDCSGTTATIVIISTNQYEFHNCIIIVFRYQLLLRFSRLIVANVGDSRAVLCRGGNAIALTEDHRPSNPSEYKRIKDAGGTIEENRELNLARLYQINPELLGASQIPQRLADMVGFVTYASYKNCHVLQMDPTYSFS